MNADPPTGLSQSFCGNCGARVSPNDTSCVSCGQPVNALPRAEDLEDLPPDDYVPYCRVGGETLRWQDANTCSSCGIAPLCSRHFHFGSGLCDDCLVATRARTAHGDAGPGTHTGREGVRGGAVTERPEFLDRFVAYIIDRIVLIPAMVVAITFGPYWPVVFLALSMVYYVGFTTWRGQTLGKMAMGVQVVNVHGDLPSLGQVVMREFVGRIACEVTLFLGYAWVFWDPQRRGWHDHISGTYVVRKARRGR